LSRDFGLPAGLYGSMVRLGWSRIAAKQALRYYNEVSPLATAVDMVAETAGLIPPLMWNGSDFSSDSPLVQALRNPNGQQPGEMFMQELTTNYRVTGNAYILAIGNLRFSPSSLQCVSSGDITWDRTSGYALHNPDGGIEQFKTHRGRHTSGNGRELIHIAAINPLKETPVAPSPLASLYYELEQYKSASLHNWALLTNGAHPGMVIEMSGDYLSEDQQASLKREIDKFYAGAGNSGRTMVIGGTKNVLPMSMNNKDMDFRSLRTDMKSEIYNRLRVPLPLVSEGSMSLANLDSSRVLMYDNAVLPLISIMYSAIQMKLGSRFGVKQGEFLRYDPASITALQTRRLAEVASVAKIGVLSTNEIRGRLGFESIGPKGDEILGQNNRANIVGRDQDTTTNREAEAEK